MVDLVQSERRCRDEGVKPSIGSVGDANDIAMCEGIFTIPECEMLDRHRFACHAEAGMAVISYVEGWYNPGRRHSGIGYLSPIAYEDRISVQIETT